MSNRGIIVIGAGGHAKVVISTIQAAGGKVAAVYDDDARHHGAELLGVRVAGSISEIENLEDVRGIVAIGNNRVRRDVARRLPHLRWTSFVHPAAYVHPSVRLGAGTVVFAGAVIQPDTIVGNHVIVNTGASVDHDCRLADFAHIAPGVRLAGAVEVGEGAFLGIGSCAVPCVGIGAWATIGAGGVVVKNVPERVVAIGVPAKVKSRRGTPCDLLFMEDETR